MIGNSKYINRLPLRPTETIFSWATRYHLRFGNYRVRETKELLFGSPRIRIHPFLPSYLEHIASDELLNDLVQHHTLYPLFRYFGADQNNRYLDRLKHGKTVSIQNLIKTFGLPCASGHFYCIRCVQEELLQTGLRIYNIQSQLPGIDSCPKHGIKLLYTDNTDFGVDRHLVMPACNISDTVKAAPKNIVVASTALRLIEHSSTISFSIAHDCAPDYRSALEALGFITSNGRLRSKSLKESIENFYQDYQPISGLEYLLEFRFLGPMLRLKSRVNQHPLHHILFQTWLDHMASNTDARLINHASESPSKRNIDDQILLKIKEGCSIREIRQELNCANSVIERVASINDLKIGCLTEPRPSWYQYFLVLALLGRHRQEIANKLNLRLHKVEAEISNVSGLALWRKNLERMRRVELATARIKFAVAEHPDWSRKLIQESNSKEYYYLYVHDRERLEELLPEKQKRVGGYVNKKWEEDDVRLHDAIIGIDGAEKMAISRIGYLINDNGVLKRSMDKLPKTKLLLLKLGVLKEGE